MNPTLTDSAATNSPLGPLLLEQLFADKSADRRRWPRRQCAPVRVFVSDGQCPSPSPSSSSRLWQGCVLDSSAGGLGLKLLGSKPPMGSVLRVSRCSVPALEASVRVRVVHVRQDFNCCVIGCEFLEKPPPSVLILFG